MLFKGTATRSAEDIAQAIDSIGGQLDAFTAKEYASYYIKVLDEHLPLALDILSDIVLQPGVQPRRHRAREEGRPRRDQDGRGHARRSRPRALHAGLLGGPPARPADSRHARDGRVVHRRPAARLLPQRLHAAQPDRLGRRQPRARARARAGRARSSASLPSVGEPLGEHAPPRRAEDPDPQQGARAEPRLPRRRAAIRRTTTTATRATC